ncbi:MAG: hypothetical protein HY016_09305 [Nitrosomonadales bacterium]|nr:hypothetical protein [Nitrosomonadales bacterium]
MKNMACFFAVLCSLVLVGCATLPPTIDADVLTRIKRFSTVSMVADTVSREYVGYTAFGNEFEEMDISQWDIDKLYATQLASAVQAVFGATYVPDQHSLAVFKQVNDLNGPWDAPAYWGPNWSKIEVAAKTYCRENSLDALFVVAKRKSLDVFGGTNQRLEALATYAYRDISVIYLSAEVALIDCVSGKALVVRSLLLPAEFGAKDKSAEPTNVIAGAVNYFTHLSLSGTNNKSIRPMKEVSTDISKKPIPEWSETVKAIIRQELIDLPIQAWAETLRTMLPSEKESISQLVLKR